MSKRLRFPLPPEIVAAQRAASDPAQSVWVGANAGSGKTYVLTARVLRLLLAGTLPEQILCLTYTKAAAAEMRARVSERLGKWSLMAEAELVADIATLTGTAPAVAERLRARTLFAHALDTPGGLKIQTIHAFCEAVLHRFPREADVPFDFSVIEDFERDAMLLEAREHVIAAGLRGGPQALAVQTLFTMLSDFQIETAIVEALSKPAVLRRVLGQRADAMVTLRRLVGTPGGVDDVLDEISRGYSLSSADHNRIFMIERPVSGGDGFVDRLATIDPARADARLLMEAYLTQMGTARKSPLRKSTAVLVPAIAERIGEEADRLERLVRRLVAAELVDRSEALFEIVGAIVERFETAKAARSLLDFDDLIERLARLLGDEGRGAWVRYKLDSDISHILVDEAQDTNPRQWAVIRALMAEFFYGKGAVERPRTLFVVGDQKQSIFSFQGAEPREFVDLKTQLVFTAQAVTFELTTVPLVASFRTLPNILAAVDIVFRRDDLEDALLEAGVVHRTARAEEGGTVTLWEPLREPDDDTDPDAWPTAPPPNQTQSAPRRVAERIAREIKGWIDGKRPLGPRGVPVTAGDILVLVQVRSVLFHEVIRALVKAGIPTPGADRLPVTTHLAALDLMALGDVLCNSADDLQLAALLRSPLFDVPEADLEEIAHERGKVSLWQALRGATRPSLRQTFALLQEWRQRLDFERPFNFYTSVLYQAGGLSKFRARMGSEVDDVFAEFLELALQHEQSPQPSLLGFLAELRSREVTIKRELGDAGSGGVRVMTVHGAKGLEAPIVILADAASTEIGRDRRSIYMLPDLPLFFHASSKDSHTGETMRHRDDAERAQKEEYWRKLYVAMTRAEDELYVTGYLTKRGKLEGTWYEAIAESLRGEAEAVHATDGSETLIYPRERAALRAPRQTELALDAPATLNLPRLPAYALRRIVRPSLAADEATDSAPEQALITDAEQAVEWRDPDLARREGIALHALLHHLSKLPPRQWEAVATKALAALMPDHPEAHARLSLKARAILSKPDHAQLYGAMSRGEVPILARGTRNGHPITIAGRIDRLVVEHDSVWIVDYKSDARTPETNAGIPAAYRLQLGLYALVAGQLFGGRPVKASILWTGPERLMFLEKNELRDAVAGFTIG